MHVCAYTENSASSCLKGGRWKVDIFYYYYLFIACIIVGLSPPLYLLHNSWSLPHFCMLHIPHTYFFSLPFSFQKMQEDVELEWLRQTEVLYYRLERTHSNAVPQLKHNPWSLKCQQQHLQKMKENAKHRNQYSILSLTEDWLGPCSSQLSSNWTDLCLL